MNIKVWPLFNAFTLRIKTGIPTGVFPNDVINTTLAVIVDDDRIVQRFMIEAITQYALVIVIVLDVMRYLPRAPVYTKMARRYNWRL